MSYTILYFGDGKGKTTAALGLALRASGTGKKVLILQFIKARKSSEYQSIKKFNNLEIKAEGKGFFRILGDKQPADAHKRAARSTFKKAQTVIIKKSYDVIVLDEVLDAIYFRLLPEKEILALISSKSSDTVLVLTGHKASEKLIAACDLVTEMKKIKHPYDKGIKAKKGIDF